MTINHKFIPISAVQIYDPSYIHLQNTFPPATAVLAPFPPPAQAGCSGTVPLPLASTPPETSEPQEASEPDNSGKARRGYGKWREEGKLLVKLWWDKHTRLELRRHVGQVWEEIAQEFLKIWNVTSTQCQQKMKYLKDRYKESKDHNYHKTGGKSEISPFHDEIDSVLAGLSLEAGYRRSSSGCDSSSHQLLGHVCQQIVQKHNS